MQDNNKNSEYYPFVSVILLNWNGYSDTLECLQSLVQCRYPNFEVVLVDNASEDDSVERIKAALSDKKIFSSRRGFSVSDKPISIHADINNIPLKVIRNNENTGFAKGNNIGMNDALSRNPDYILLLNNDTVVESDFLNILVAFLEKNKEYKVATPQIRYYDNRDKIWNCGGKLTCLYHRKYFFEEKHIASLPDKEFIRITFITGCAMFIKTDLIKKIGLLNEAFFFGEEDFEFSLRLKKNNIKAACVLKSVIYHKVNASISKTSDFIIGKVFVHYLNRFIDLRNFLPKWKWKIWRRIYVLYIQYLLKKKYRIGSDEVSSFTRLLLSESNELKRVDKITFEKYINFDFSK